MSTVSECTMVGVSLHGQALGRDGTLSIVALSTRKSVFLVDCVALKAEAVMQRGLARLLADGGVMKVVHDSRQAADILWHKYDVDLSNVYDTLAAHIVFTAW